MSMELVYFWSAVLIALTPVLIFGGIAAWIGRKYLRERREGRQGAGIETRNAELGTRNRRS